MTPVQNNLEIVEGIRRNDGAVLQELYRLYKNRMIGHLRSWENALDTAEDIFQEAMVSIFLKTQNPDFVIHTQFFTYLYSVCWRIWLNKKRSDRQLDRVRSAQIPVLTLDPQAEKDVDDVELIKLVLEKMRDIPADCQSILSQFYLEGKSTQDIMTELNHGSRSYFYKRNSHCKDKLRDLVMDDPRFLNL